MNLRNRDSSRKGKLFVSLLAMMGAAHALAQPASGPAETALAGSVTARIECAGVIRNAAALALRAGTEVISSCSPSSIDIDGYYDGTLTAATQLDSALRIGVLLGAVGALEYREMTAGITAAMRPVNDLALGLTVGLDWLAIERYGSAVAPRFDIGVLARIAPDLRLGAVASNITGSMLADVELPQHLALGLALDLDSTTSLSLDLGHELQRSAHAALGLSTTIVPNLTLRAGIRTQPVMLGFGFGCALGDITVDYGGAYVAPLGVRHALGVGMRW